MHIGSCNVFLSNLARHVQKSGSIQLEYKPYLFLLSRDGGMRCSISMTVAALLLISLLVLINIVKEKQQGHRIEAGPEAAMDLVGYCSCKEKMSRAVPGKLLGRAAIRNTILCCT